MNHSIMITFSGIDSSGKSTQINLLRNMLTKKGINPIIIWSRGGYTSLLQWIKDILRKLNPKIMPKAGDEEEHEILYSSGIKSRIWLFLAMLDLIRLYSVSIRILQMRGKTVICDRYLHDTEIDFHLKFPQIDFKTWILWRILLKTSVKPSLSFMFEIPLSVSLERSIRKKEPFSENRERRVLRYKAYMKMKKELRWDYYIDGTESIDKVRYQIIRALNENC